MPLLPGITPFGFPAVNFQQQYFQQQMLMAQQLGLSSNPMLMMAPQAQSQQFFQPGTLPLMTNQAAQISSPQAPLIPQQLEKEVADLKKQQERSLAEQKRLFEEKLQTRDQLFKEQLETRDREFAAKLQKVEEEAFAKAQGDIMKREAAR